MLYSLSTITSSYNNERSIVCRKIVKNPLLLARNLLSKICAELFVFIKKVITSAEFLACHRQSEKDFTRQRKLPFHVLIAFLINFVRGSYQDELDKFFKVLHRLDVPRRVVSKVALTKARMKVRFQVFIDLNHQLIAYFETFQSAHLAWLSSVGH